MTSRDFDLIELAWVKRDAQDLQVCVKWAPGQPSVCYRILEAADLADSAERAGQQGLAAELRRVISLAIDQAKAQPGPLAPDVCSI
jgi:hypothetical protein